jgi:predicted dehydrogenase
MAEENTMAELGVGMIGYGFIGKVHAYSYLSLPMLYTPAPAKIKFVGVCTESDKSADLAVDQLGFELKTKDYHELLDRNDIQIVNICTPNYLHKQVIMDALKTGKHIYCDKPLALNSTEAREICEAGKHVNTTQQMTFEYRFIPAIMRAKEMVQSGFLGDVYSFRASYLHSGYVDANRPISWRLQMDKSGGGAICDLGSHVIDLLRYLLGDFKRVCARLKTFIRERPAEPGGAQKSPVTVDDIAIIQAELLNGAIGTIEASRLATGANDDLRFEVNGSRGALAFSLMEPNWLYAYDNTLPDQPLGGEKGFTKIECVQRYPAPASLPGPKFAAGWMRFHVASIYDFVQRVSEGRRGYPSFEDAKHVHEVTDAAIESSQTERWVNVID